MHLVSIHHCCPTNVLLRPQFKTCEIWIKIPTTFDGTSFKKKALTSNFEKSIFPEICCVTLAALSQQAVYLAACKLPDWIPALPKPDLTAFGGAVLTSEQLNEESGVSEISPRCSRVARPPKKQHGLSIMCMLSPAAAVSMFCEGGTCSPSIN